MARVNQLVTSRRSSKITKRAHTHEYYSDFERNFDLVPITGALDRDINEVAVMHAIENLVMTRKGERFYHPGIGSDVFNSMFDLFTDLAGDKIAQSITNCIAQNEPRVNNVVVQVVSDPTNNAYNATISFTLVNVPTVTQTMSLIISRVR